MTILDCCMSLKIIKKNLVVLGVVDMHQLLLNIKSRLEIIGKIGCFSNRNSNQNSWKILLSSAFFLQELFKNYDEISSAEKYYCFLSIKTNDNRILLEFFNIVLKKTLHYVLTLFSIQKPQKVKRKKCMLC